MTQWDRMSLGARIDRVILESLPARWLRVRSAAAPRANAGPQRLWPSVAILLVATAAAAVAWVAPPGFPMDWAFPALGACAALAVMTRLLCSGHIPSLFGRLRLDERDQAVRREAYAKTYLMLTLLGAAGLFAVMVEGLTGTSPRLEIGLHAAIVFIFGSIVHSAMPGLLEANQYGAPEA